MKVNFLFLFVFLGVYINAQSIVDSAVVKEIQASPQKKEWYKTISLRGYTQVRYNRLLETN